MNPRGDQQAEQFAVNSLPDWQQIMQIVSKTTGARGSVVNVI